MEGATTVKCTTCKKEIATDYARCTSCGNAFHPGCYKPHKILGPDGEKATCPGRMQAIKRAGSAPALPATSLATGSSTSPGVSPTPEPTLAAVLTAVKACSDAIASFKASQEKHNDEAEGHLTNLRKDLSGRLDRLSADLRSVATRVKEVEAAVDTLKTDVHTVASKHDALSASLNERLSAVEEQQRTFAEVVSSSTKTAQADSLKALALRVTKLEGERRDRELVISGLPEQPQEDLRELLVKTAAAVGKPLIRADITRISRMRGAADPARPRLIHAVMASRDTRDALLRAKREKRQLKATDIDNSFVTSRLIYINEYLPRDTLALLKAVRAEARTRGYRSVWHRAGSICVRKDEASKPIIIRSLEDIPDKLC